MTIIRTPRPERNFTILDNNALRNPQLSYRARGVLAYLLSMPDDWRTSADHLARAGREGRDALRAALAELAASGHLIREKRQDPDTGQWVTVSTVYDIPPRLGIKQWKSPDPTTGNPTTGNPSLIEELTTKDFTKELNLVTDSDLEVCGLCAGTTWTVNDDNEVVRCDCPGGVWPDGRP